MAEDTYIPQGSKARQAPDREKVGLPARVFLFTIDQVAVMLDLPVRSVTMQYLYLEGRSIGRRENNQMSARNIAPADAAPEWRVAERELIRWLKVKGFKYYDRGAIGY